MWSVQAVYSPLQCHAPWPCRKGFEELSSWGSSLAWPGRNGGTPRAGAIHHRDGERQERIRGAAAIR